MSLFDGIEKASIRVPRLYLRGGKYICRILEMKTGNNRKREPFFVTNLLVCVCTDASAAMKNVRGPLLPGEKPSWMVMAKWDSFLPTVKGLIAVLAGGAEEEVTREVVDFACSPQQPFKNEFIELDCWDRVDDEDPKKVFTNVNPLRVVPLEEVMQKMTPEQHPLLATI